MGGAKSTTTPDIVSGVEESIKIALNQSKIKSSEIDVLIIGTTHFVNALIQRKKLAKRRRSQSKY